jgi:hypothetical protein
VIELVDGFWVDPLSVTVVKAINEKSCAIWTTGQSALEGHILDYPAADVVEAIEDACNEPSDEEDSDDDDD